MDVKPRKPRRSDLSDARRAVIEPILPPSLAAGTHRKTTVQKALHAIFHVRSTGRASWTEARRLATPRLSRMQYKSGVGHIGGNLSCLDLMIAKTLLERGLGPERFASRPAGPYAPGRHGSQKFHRREYRLDPRPSSISSSPRAPEMAREHTPAISLADKIRRLQGPILVLGASGFVGANLLRTLVAVRHDVFGTTTRKPAWRLDDLPDQQVRMVDLLIDSNLDALLNEIQPRTIFNCVAYGAYSFEVDSPLIYRTNFNFVTRLLTRLDWQSIACYVHAGSSSEYGDNAAGPAECAPLAPNSDYAVSKAAAANLIYFYGKRKNLPCANLRLYSVYGPLEDSSRLIPNVVRHGLDGTYPQFVNPAVSRDFVFVDDVTEAFVDTALNLSPADYGESINIGSGRKTTIAEVAAICRDLFGITAQPCFTMPDRHWDVQDWYANIGKARECIGWTPRACFCDGLKRTVDWYRALPDKTKYYQSSKKFGLDTVYSVSAVVACYKDNLAIPIMYDRLKATFTKLNIDFEIVFVNDCSPDDSEEVIRAISQNDRRVLGISHSRNFGSQSAFRSGMEIASKNACVLLDGDLQDPPELIEQFVTLWRQGYDVVYGRRGKREATLFMQVAYKAFYRVFDYFSYIAIPHDAGDFSLMDRRVVRSLLQFPERDLFLRGVRAFAGFKQVGVDYVRPERMFGVSTNNLLKNIGWAKKGILSFSNTPLNILSAAGTALFVISCFLAFVQIVARLAAPQLVSPGFTTTILLVLFFGSINLFAIAIVGEYIAKIFEEVKHRPLFIRKSVIRDGEVRLSGDGRLTTSGG
jgi:polyisoprenyl-phosphate glycosyltransferase